MKKLFPFFTLQAFDAAIVFIKAAYRFQQARPVQANECLPNLKVIVQDRERQASVFFSKQANFNQNEGIAVISKLGTHLVA